MTKQVLPISERQSEDDSLSALLDGELTDETARMLLHRVAGSGAARARFREYCFIGDALRGLDRDMPDLTDRVLSVLDKEPTVLAPMRKPQNRRPALWLAAASVIAITWGVWNTVPREEARAPMAANPGMTLAGGVEAGNAMPYLAAHQDFAQAVVAPPEMRFTKVTLAGAGQ